MSGWSASSLDSFASSPRLQDQTRAVSMCRLAEREYCLPVLERLCDSPFEEVRLRARAKLNNWQLPSREPQAPPAKVARKKLPKQTPDARVRRHTTSSALNDLRSSDARVVWSARAYLRGHTFEVHPALVQYLLHDPTTSVRKRAAELLAGIPDPGVSEALEMAVLTDADSDVRQEALAALCKDADRRETGLTLVRLIQSRADAALAIRARNFAEGNLEWRRMLTLHLRLDSYEPPDAFAFSNLPTSTEAAHARRMAAQALMRVRQMSDCDVQQVIDWDWDQMTEEQRLVRDLFEAASMSSSWTWKHMSVAARLRELAQDEDSLSARALSALGLQPH